MRAWSALLMTALLTAQEYRPIDGHGHQALYAFMNQDPRRPAPGVSVPMLASAPRLDGSERDLR